MRLNVRFCLARVISSIEIKMKVDVFMNVTKKSKGLLMIDLF